ncbi:MAG TPA: hypothetical protein VJK53_05070 [Candidatus Paceibacterota bacterium]
MGFELFSQQLIYWTFDKKIVQQRKRQLQGVRAMDEHTKRGAESLFIGLFIEAMWEHREQLTEELTPVLGQWEDDSADELVDLLITLAKLDDEAPAFRADPRFQAIFCGAGELGISERSINTYLDMMSVRANYALIQRYAVFRTLPETPQMILALFLGLMNTELREQLRSELKRSYASAYRRGAREQHIKAAIHARVANRFPRFVFLHDYPDLLEGAKKNRH